MNIIKKLSFLIIETNLLKFDMDRTNDFIIHTDTFQLVIVQHSLKY